MGTDYEAEYNNRARVPEHAEIFARWTQDAAAYRLQASADGRAELGLAYGPSPRQTIDLFLPAEGATAPLALFIHGGYWRSLEPSMFSHMARGPNGHGIAVAVAGYDLCPTVSIGDIIGQVRQACLYLWRRFGRRMVVHGHSAGGHLSACMLATDWKAEGATTDIVPAAFSISGLFDLTPLTSVAMNAELGLSPESARAASPLFWQPPFGATFDSWCGALESSEFRRQNRVLVDAWAREGVHTACHEVPGANHFNILDPLTEPDSDMTARLVAMTGAIPSNSA